MMNRFLYLIIFICKNYWRKQRLLVQFILLAITCFFLFDPRFAPYPFDYIVVVKNIFLIITSYYTDYHMSWTNYNRRLYIILSRVSRRLFYLASLFSTIIVALIISFLMDLYLSFFSGLGVGKIFSPGFILTGLFSILLAVSVAHLFSIYTVGPYLRTLGFIIISFGTIPEWYKSLPLEPFLKNLSYLLPPLGKTIIIQMSASVPLYLYLYQLLYSILIIEIGIRVMERRSLVAFK